MAKDSILNYKVGQRITDAEGNIKVFVTKITDGTLATTFKHHLYGLADNKDWIRDEKGAIIVKTSREYLDAPEVHINQLKPKKNQIWKLLRDEPDTEDKRIWFVVDAVFDETETVLPAFGSIPAQIKKEYKLISGEHRVLTHDEFLKFMEDIKADIEKTKQEVQAEQMQTAVIAANAVAEKAYNRRGKK